VMVPVSIPEGVLRRSALALGIDPLRMDPCPQWSVLAELMHSPMVTAANATRPMGIIARALSRAKHEALVRNAATGCYHPLRLF
jgi:hypothetical protein